MTKSQFNRKERRYKRLWREYQLMKDKNSPAGKAFALRLNKMYEELIDALVI